MNKNSSTFFNFKVFETSTSLFSTRTMPRLSLMQTVNPQTRTRRNSRKRKSTALEEDDSSSIKKRRKVASASHASPSITATPSASPCPADTEGSDADSNPESSPEELFCLCRQPYDGTFMIQCPNPDCGEWFHPKCLNSTMKALSKLDISEFVCPLCSPSASVPSNKPIPKKKKIKKSKEKKSTTAKTKKSSQRHSKSTKNNCSNIHINDGNEDKDENVSKSTNPKPSESRDRIMQTEEKEDPIINQLRAELDAKNNSIKALKEDIARYDLELKTLKQCDDDRRKYLQLNEALNKRLRDIVEENCSKTERIKNQEKVIDSQRDTIYKLKEEIADLRRKEKPSVVSRGVEAMTLQTVSTAPSLDDLDDTDSTNLSQRMVQEKHLEIDNVFRSAKQIESMAPNISQSESSTDEWWQCDTCGAENSSADVVCIVCSYQSQAM